MAPEEMAARFDALLNTAELVMANPAIAMIDELMTGTEALGLMFVLPDGTAPYVFLFSKEMLANVIKGMTNLQDQVTFSHTVTAGMSSGGASGTIN